jgi:hypothetical protein
VGRRRRQWTPFWPPLLPANKPISNKTRGQYKYINFYFNLLNLFNRFDGGIGKICGRPPTTWAGYGFIKSTPLEG